MCDKLAGKFFWKGKHVTEKIFNLRTRQAAAGKKLQSFYGCKENKNSEQSDAQSNLNDKQSEPNVEGRRIVHIKTLSKQMFCWKCSQMLSLCNIVDENLIGLACIWTIQCDRCSSTTRVATDQKHKKKVRTKQGKEMFRYDVNVAGAMGNTNVFTARV